MSKKMGYGLGRVEVGLMMLAMARQCLVFLWYGTGLVALLCGGSSPRLPVVYAAAPGTVQAQATHGHPQAAAFVLNDQYGRPLDYRFPRETISVMFFADYTGSGQLEAWIRPLYDRYEKRIGIYGVADLSVVPGFMRGLVARVFREQLQYPVMFDWHGTVSRRSAAQSGQANLYLGTLSCTSWGR
jgi:hypothetical protein